MQEHFTSCITWTNGVDWLAVANLSFDQEIFELVMTENLQLVYFANLAGLSRYPLHLVHTFLGDFLWF